MPEMSGTASVEENALKMPLQLDGRSRHGYKLFATSNSSEEKYAF
jgi:hypothetical protein